MHIKKIALIMGTLALTRCAVMHFTTVAAQAPMLYDDPRCPMTHEGAVMHLSEKTGAFENDLRDLISEETVSNNGCLRFFTGTPGEMAYFNNTSKNTETIDPMTGATITGGTIYHYDEPLLYGNQESTRMLIAFAASRD